LTGGSGGDQALIAPLIAAAALAYALGTRRLSMRRPLHGRGAHRQGIWFGAGLAVLAVTLLGPLEDWTRESFAAHMLQHELLMLAAAPLLVLGRPLARFAWLLPAASRRRLPGRLVPVRALLFWGVFTSVAGSFSIQTFALFAWHVPRWFRWAVEHPAVHVLQHLTFLAVALGFWWCVLRPGPPRRVAPAAVAALFLTTLTTGALGALLTFTTRAWYALPGAVPPFHLTTLEDQQLGGLLMWVPGGLVYMGAALLLGARVLSTPRARDRAALVADA
jgi:putative membrane protein